MNAAVRNLIHKAELSENNAESLSKIYKILRRAQDKSLMEDSLNECESDLYVLCAELALKQNEIITSSSCLGMYFSENNAPNEFLCRAYLCQAQILFKQHPASFDALLTAVVYLMKVLELCKGKPKYSFLIFNTSVLYWSMIREFTKAKYQPKLCTSLLSIVKALDDIDDEDYDWRATLKIGLVVSYVKAEKLKEATSISSQTYWFCLKHCKNRIPEIIKLQIKYNLVDLNKLSLDIAEEYKAFIKLKQLKINPVQREETLQELIRIVTSLKKGNLDGWKHKKYSSQEELTLLQNVISEEFTEIDPMVEKSMLRSSDSLDKDEFIFIKDEDVVLLKSNIRIILLFEIARLCVDCKELELASICLSTLKQLDIQDQNILLQIEFLESYFEVKKLGEKEKILTQSNVDIRLESIRRIMKTLQSAIRCSIPNVLQAGCTFLWNLCLPLLQKDLRKSITIPLQLIAETLENISSTNFQLRCQVHTEIAFSLEIVDQNEAAIKHLEKAIRYDDGGLYKERLETTLHRLKLSSQLYETPERAEDVAAVIIEQAKKCDDSGSILMKRSLLVKVGSALAPEDFQNVLDAEDVSKSMSTNSTNLFEKLKLKSEHWKNCIKKSEGYLKRHSNSNHHERVRLWVDLVKTSRQQRIWDVCRIASIFCLFYDDNRWSITKGLFIVGFKQILKKAFDEDKSESVSSTLKDKEEVEIQRLQRRDFLKMLAEVSLILGEAFIHFIQNEGLQFNDIPKKQDFLQKITNPHQNFPDEEIHFEAYCEWIRSLNERATNCFLRGIEIGVDLNECWLVSNGSIYLWNYNCHLMMESRYTEIVSTFQTVLQSLTSLPHQNQSILITRICNVIGRGLLLPWIPKPSKNSLEKMATVTRKSAKSRKSTIKDTNPNLLMVSSDAAEDLKEALKVVEFGLNLTHGDVTISMFIRHPLIITWVELKQLMTQQIQAPFYESENENPQELQMLQALVVIEMLSANNKKLFKFVIPSLQEIFQLIDDVSWDDPVIELYLWEQLSFNSCTENQHQLVLSCVDKVLKMKDQSLKILMKEKKSQIKEYRIKLAYKHISNIYQINGKSIISSSIINLNLRKKALNSFLDSVLYGKKANSYRLVMTSSRLWWQTLKPLMTSSHLWWSTMKPLMTSLGDDDLELRKSLTDILSCVDDVIKSGDDVMKDENSEESTVESRNDSPKSTSSEDSDLEFQISLYGLLFKTFAEKVSWSRGRWSRGRWSRSCWSRGCWSRGRWSRGCWSRGCWSRGRWSRGCWSRGCWSRGHWSRGC